MVTTSTPRPHPETSSTGKAGFRPHIIPRLSISGIPCLGAAPRRRSHLPVTGQPKPSQCRSLPGLEFPDTLSQGYLVLVSSAPLSRLLRYQRAHSDDHEGISGVGSCNGGVILWLIFPFFFFSFLFFFFFGSARRGLSHHQQRGWRMQTRGQGMLGRTSSLYLRFSHLGLQYPYSLSNIGGSFAFSFSYQLHLTALMAVLLHH